MASATNEDVLAAVMQLDYLNDEHWTADGLPRLDAVENLLGSDVSRKAVTGAAPTHNRGAAQTIAEDASDAATAGEVDPDAEVPEFEDGVDIETSEGDDTVEASEQTPSPEQTETPADDTAPVDDTSATVQDDEEGDDPLGTGPAELEAGMDQDIEDLEAELVKIDVHLREGRDYRLEVEERLAAARDAKNQAFPPMTAAEAIQAFQKNELRKRAVSRGDGKTVSELDKAYRARGKVRPRGPVATKQEG